MRSRKGIIITIIIAVLVILGIITAVVYAQSNNQNENNDMNGADAMSGMSNNSMSDDTKAVETDMVNIKDFAFSPSTITVKAGTTVTWTNNDAVRHSVTSDDGSDVMFDSGLISTNATYTMKFDKAGTYHYHCTPHPYMKATVIVT